jgi:hypothetical protein
MNPVKHPTRKKEDYMKSKPISLCCALAMALSLLIGNNGVQGQASANTVQAIPETDFTAANSISLFSTFVTEGYPPKQLTLKSGNGVADFVQSPGWIQDMPPWYFTPNSSQIVADGTTSYTKVIPFGKSFDVKFKVQIIGPGTNPLQGPPPGPYGGTVFELHDTDPVFAQYGDPSHSCTHLDETNGSYTFYVNNVALWTSPYTLKTWDSFELSGVLAKDSTSASGGKLELKRNGVVVATSTGVNSDSMTPTYPIVPGTPPTPLARRLIL